MFGRQWFSVVVWYDWIYVKSVLRFEYRDLWQRSISDNLIYPGSVWAIMLLIFKKQYCSSKRFCNHVYFFCNKYHKFWGFCVCFTWWLINNLYLQLFLIWRTRAQIRVFKCISQKSGWTLWYSHSATSCARSLKAFISFFVVILESNSGSHNKAYMTLFW